VLLYLSFVVVLLGLAWRVPFVWRHGQATRSGRPPSWWAWGVGGWQAYARGLPSVAGFWAFGFAATLLGGRISGLMLAGAAVCGCLAASVVLFNRPRFVVPPPRRADKGLLVLARSGRP
jgi:hypothetical protein